jgi:hypothetical protein
MSTLSVPCRAPYEVASPDNYADKVTLKVGRGKDMEVFEVPVVLLCKGSEWFEQQ